MAQHAAPLPMVEALSSGWPATQRARLLPSVAASAASASTALTSTAVKAPQVSVKHAYGFIAPTQLGEWALDRQFVSNRRLCSVPTPANAFRGICPGAEVPMQMCDADHSNFIFAGRDVN